MSFSLSSILELEGFAFFYYGICVEVITRAQPQSVITVGCSLFQLALRVCVAELKREEILLLFKELRSSCHGSNSVSSNVVLVGTGCKDALGREDFVLQLRWVPDERSRTFLKEFTLKHNLSIRERGKTVTIYSNNGNSVSSVDSEEATIELPQNRVRPCF